jgi:hypothetical protein
MKGNIMQSRVVTPHVATRLGLLLAGQTVSIRFVLTDAMVLELLQHVFGTSEPTVLFYAAVAEQLAASGSLTLWQEILQHPTDYHLQSIGIEEQNDQKYVVLRYEREAPQSA